MSSWDIQRACDSPSKTDIKLAWMRLRIPPYIADYLIAIDSEGKTLIQSVASSIHNLGKETQKSNAATHSRRGPSTSIQCGASCKSRSYTEPNDVASILRHLTNSALIPSEKDNILPPGLPGTHTTHHTWMTLSHHRQH